jgi:hypothetical protein
VHNEADMSSECKIQSARNATHHGFLARTLPPDCKSVGRLHNVVTSLRMELQPETPAEVAAVEGIRQARKK